jgi:hypothetical protein
MNRDQNCQQETLSQHSCFQINRCSCGAYHVSIGAITIRLAPESFSELSAVVSAARAKIQEPNLVTN